MGARPRRARGVGGDLARHRPADRDRDAHRRGDVGRGAAAVPRAQRLPRGDLPHVLLQPADRRQRPHRRHAVRRQRGDRAGASASAGWPRCATSGRGATTITEDEVLAARAPASGRQPARPAVLARLPVRRRRTAASRAARLHRHAGRAPRRRARGGRWPRPSRGDRAGRARRALPDLPTGAWDEPPVDALVLPLPQTGQGAPLRIPGRGPQPLPAARRRATARSSGSSRARSRRGSRARAPTRPSAAAPRRWRSSTAPRPRSSPTSATSCARR